MHRTNSSSSLAQATFTGSGPTPDATAPTNAKAKAKATSPFPSSSSSRKRKTALATDSVSRTGVGTQRQTFQRKSDTGPGSGGGGPKLSARNVALPPPPPLLNRTVGDTLAAKREVDRCRAIPDPQLGDSSLDAAARSYQAHLQAGKPPFEDLLDPEFNEESFSRLVGDPAVQAVWKALPETKGVALAEACQRPSRIPPSLAGHPRAARAGAGAARKKPASGAKAKKTAPKRRVRGKAASSPAPRRGAAGQWRASANQYSAQVRNMAALLTDEVFIVKFPEDAQNELRNLGLAYTNLLYNLTRHGGTFQLAYASALVDEAAEAAQGGADDPLLLTGTNVQSTNPQPTDEGEDEEEFEDDKSQPFYVSDDPYGDLVRNQPNQNEFEFLVSNPVQMPAAPTFDAIRRPQQPPQPQPQVHPVQTTGAQPSLVQSSSFPAIANPFDDVAQSYFGPDFQKSAQNDLDAVSVRATAPQPQIVSVAALSVRPKSS